MSPRKLDLVQSNEDFLCRHFYAQGQLKFRQMCLISKSQCFDSLGPLQAKPYHALGTLMLSFVADNEQICTSKCLYVAIERRQGLPMVPSLQRFCFGSRIFFSSSLFLMLRRPELSFVLHQVCLSDFLAITFYPLSPVLNLILIVFLPFIFNQ